MFITGDRVIVREMEDAYGRRFTLSGEHGEVVEVINHNGKVTFGVKLDNFPNDRYLGTSYGLIKE